MTGCVELSRSSLNKEKSFLEIGDSIISTYYGVRTVHCTSCDSRAARMVRSITNLLNRNLSFILELQHCSINTELAHHRKHSLHFR